MVDHFFSLSYLELCYIWIQRDIPRTPDKKRPQFSKISNLDMIIIYIGKLMYPVKDSAERCIFF